MPPHAEHQPGGHAGDAEDDEHPVVRPAGLGVGHERGEQHRRHGDETDRSQRLGRTFHRRGCHVAELHAANGNARAGCVHGRGGGTVSTHGWRCRFDPHADDGEAPIPDPMGMTLDSNDAVRVRGLRKSYGERAALDGVDLTMARGEVLALLGPNGAGKTTLVEILEGHRKPDAGTVSVLGFDPDQARARVPRADRDRPAGDRPGPRDQRARGRRALQRRLLEPARPRRGARPGRPEGPREHARQGPLRRPAPAPGPRARPRRRPRADLPRRADHGLRSRRAPPVVGADLQPARARQDDPADHALHGRGAAARRPHRRADQGPHHRRRRARRARPRGRRDRLLPGARLPRGHAAAGRRA